MTKLRGLLALFIPFVAAAVVYGQDLKPADLWSVSAPVVGTADGCVVTPFSCNSTIRGRLAAGDCTTNTGAFFDTLEFSAVAGTIVEVTVRPISPSFKDPTLILAPPMTDASKPPIFVGGAGATIRYLPAVSGRWRVGVTSDDPFSSGDYVVSIRCSPDDAPDLKQSCINQELLCGQTALWYLTNQSCTFSSAPDRAYAEFEIYGVQGDSFSIELLSTEFLPAFAVYDFSKGSREIAISRSIAASKDTLYMVVPSTGFYQILVFSEESRGLGFFALTMACSRSGCLSPIILRQPNNFSVQYGQSALLSAEVSALSPTQINWLDITSFPSVIGQGPSFTTGPVTRPTLFGLQVVNPCGSANGSNFTVTPTQRRRAARR